MFHRFYLTITLIVCQSTLAEAAVLNTTFESGRRSTSDVFEEEDDEKDDDFRYVTYRLKLKNPLTDKSSLNLSAERYRKDYVVQDNLDNRSTTTHLRIDIAHSDKLNLDIGTSLKQKHFKDSPQLEYDKSAFGSKADYFANEFFSFGYEFGLKRFDFLTADKDELKTTSKLSSKLEAIKDAVILNAFYKTQRIDRKQRADRFFDVFGFGIDFTKDLSILRLLRFKIEKGEDETVEIDEREDVHDFEFLRWSVKGDIKPLKRLSASVKYEDLQKDYTVFDHDYEGFLIENSWRYEPINKRDKLMYFNLTFGYKELDYSEKSTLTYKKESVGFKATYNRKKDHKVSAGFGISNYDFPQNSDNNKRPYSIAISFEKQFLKQAAKLTLSLKRTIKDYKNRTDVKQDSIKIGITSQF